MKEQLIQIDKSINGIFGSNSCVTISKQDSFGVMERHDFQITEKTAMKEAHGNMIGAGIGIFVGFFCFRKNPAVGFIFLIIGILVLSVVIKDWQAGKKYVSRVNCAVQSL